MMSRCRVVTAVIAGVSAVVSVVAGCASCRRQHDDLPLEDSCDSASVVGEFRCTTSQGIAGLSGPEATAVRCAEQAVELNGYTDAGGARRLTTYDLLESTDKPCRILL